MGRKESNQTKTNQPIHMLWVLKRTVSMRRFFWAPKTYAKNDGPENIHNYKLQICVYLNLYCLVVFRQGLTLKAPPIICSRRQF